MHAVIQGFRNFGDDIVQIAKQGRATPDLGRKVCAIALRALGYLAALAATVTTIAAIVSIIGSGLIPIALTIVSIFAVIVAHELIVIGNNISKFMSAPSVQESVVEAIIDNLEEVGIITGPVHKVPPTLRTTWVIQPVYEFFRN